VLAGDLNSNVRWDKWDRWWNHTDGVRERSNMGLVGVYHRSRGIPQGSEPEPTTLLQRNPAKAYHIDYALAPVAWLGGCSAWVGESDQWLQWNDHMPLVVRVDDPDEA
jgi:hypothetical protein